jgi:purine-nucleoside phosphorylase
MKWRNNMEKTDCEAPLLYIKNKITDKPDVGIVLGRGLGDMYKLVENPVIISYNEILGFPVSTVSGHAGRFIYGRLCGSNVIMMQGRVHYYEGYTMEQVVMPIRIMGMLGIKTLILTNAAGGINDKLQPGDIMIINDHISSFVPSPLIGPNDDSIGCRFPDMSHVYNERYVELLDDIMTRQNIKHMSGTYVQTTGPAYETPAEIRMFKLLGADAVGMSTVCEAVAAAHMGIHIAGLSFITNKAAGLGGDLKHEDVLAASDGAFEKVGNVLKEFVSETENL